MLNRGEVVLKQQTLSSFEKFGKTTRRAQFLLDMDRIIPWPKLAAAVHTVYPKVSQAGGRPPIPVERMLRIYFLQLWFNLSDPAVEEALYDSVAMRGFAGIDLGVESVPDETTVCKFRHLLERHKLGKTLLTAVNDHLHRSGSKIARGTIVDATIIGAPSSTKNKTGERDPEMHQTAKGQQWYFGSQASAIHADCQHRQCGHGHGGSLQGGQRLLEHCRRSHPADLCRRCARASSGGG